MTKNHFHYNKHVGILDNISQIPGRDSLFATKVLGPGFNWQLEMFTICPWIKVLNRLKYFLEMSTYLEGLECLSILLIKSKIYILVIEEL